jgi:hypothetical protein
MMGQVTAISIIEYLKTVDSASINTVSLYISESYMVTQKWILRLLESGWVEVTYDGIEYHSRIAAKKGNQDRWFRIKNRTC